MTRFTHASNSVEFALAPNVSPSCAKTKTFVQGKRANALHTDSRAYIRNFAILSLRWRSGDFCRDHAAFGSIRKGVGDQERIPANLLNLVVGEVGCISCCNHLLYESGINRLRQQEGTLVGGVC